MLSGTRGSNEGQPGPGRRLPASTLARVDPFQVRPFRLTPADRTARVRAIRLPVGQEEASKFVREAVRTYPELYFARLAVLGEGASEEVVLPRRFGKSAAPAGLGIEAPYELAAPSTPPEVQAEVERRIVAGEIIGAWPPSHRQRTRWRAT
jgi:hypothetical protein